MATSSLSMIKVEVEDVKVNTSESSALPFAFTMLTTSGGHVYIVSVDVIALTSRTLVFSPL